MSCQPSRLTTLNFGLMNTCHFARRSAHVTCLPSLHTADGLYANVTVTGRCFTSFGMAVNSRGVSTAFAL